MPPYINFHHAFGDLGRFFQETMALMKMIRIGIHIIREISPIASPTGDAFNASASGPKVKKIGTIAPKKISVEGQPRFMVCLSGTCSASVSALIPSR